MIEGVTDHLSIDAHRQRNQGDRRETGHGSEAIQVSREEALSSALVSATNESEDQR